MSKWNGRISVAVSTVAMPTSRSSGRPLKSWRPSHYSDARRISSRPSHYGAAANDPRTTLSESAPRVNAVSPHPYSGSRRRPRCPESATAALACLGVGGKQLPAPLGDDFDGTVDDFDGGLVVDRIRRPRQAGGPPFGSGHGVCRQVRVFDVREDRKIDHAQRSVSGRR